MKEFERLIQIMAALRSEQGCPWDREQTHRSLVPFFMEEVLETIETIEKNDMKGLCEELGDTLLQIVFHAQIACEHKSFTIEDVIQGINEKLVRRHPHVFSDEKAGTADEVLKQWNKIKAEEKEQRARSSSKPTVSPAIMGEKGFKAADIEEAFKQTGELPEEREGNPAGKEKIYFGKLLYRLLLISRSRGVNPMEALKQYISFTEGGKENVND